MEEKIISIINEGIAVKEALRQKSTVSTIAKLVKLAIACLRSGGKIILFGNGGSASDSQHIAAELVGRFSQERKALAAIALSCNTSNLSAIGNDYGFEQIFSRQIEALGQKKDLAVGITTSGTSPNVLAGLAEAKQLGMNTAILTGNRAPQFKGLVELSVIVPSKNTARIQEAHIAIGHIICELVENAFLDKKK